MSDICNNDPELKKDEILKSNKIIRFLNSRHSQETRGGYEGDIIRFFKFVGENPETYLIKDYEFLELEEKKKSSNKYKRDLEDYKIYLMNYKNSDVEKYKDGTIRTKLSIIHSCFTFNEIDFPTGFWKRLNNFKNTVSSIRETPTPEQLRKILDNTDIQGKCIFGIMKDSGSRIGSVISLKKEDINMDRIYPSVNFYSKSVKNRITKTKRITPETKHFLESYFDKHQFKESDRIFPMTKQNATYKWGVALKKTKFFKEDKHTNRSTMTTQCLKRFFKTNTFNIHKGLSDYFSEHNNLDQRYINMSNEKLDKEYAKFVNELLVYERPYDTDIRIKHLQKDNDELQGKLKFTKDKLSIIENKNEGYEQKFSKIEKSLNISLNPETPENKNLLSFCKESMPGLLKNLSKGKITDKEIENLQNLFVKEATNALETNRKIPMDEKIEIINSKDFNEMYRKIKAKQI